MKKTRMLFSVAISTLLLVGCGGGSDAPPAAAPSPSPTPAPPPASVTIDTPPSATLAAKDAQTARGMASEAQKAAEDAVQFDSLPMPGGVQILPGGGTVTSNCGTAGSFTYTYPDTAPTAGWSGTFTYNNCTYVSAGYSFVFNGTITYTFTRYVSGTDYAFRVATQNFSYSYTYNGEVVSSGTYSYVVTYDTSNGVASWSYQTATGAAVANISVSRSDGNVTVSGSYVVDSSYAGGVIKMTFNNWTYSATTGRPVSGSVLVEGANGTRIDIVATSTGYTVTYTAANGAQTAYTVTY